MNTIRNPQRWLAGGLFLTLLAGFLLAMSAVHAQDTAKIPKKVMDTLKAKFPRAKIDKWAREKEGGKVVYDFEFKQDGRKFEADILADGTIHNWEKAIPARDLPKAVRQTVKKKYPKARVKEIMAVTAVKAGKEVLEGYEVVVVTADKKTAEIMVSPGGKVLEEDSADEK
jgi:hypothetical protein